MEAGERSCGTAKQTERIVGPQVRLHSEWKPLEILERYGNHRDERHADQNRRGLPG